MLTMPLLLTSFHRRYGRLPYEGVADSSYGSELPLHGGEQHTDLCQVQLLPHGAETLLQKSPRRVENLHYNAEGDYFVCPIGQHMRRVDTWHNRNESDYIIEPATYRAQHCQGLSI